MAQSYIILFTIAFIANIPFGFFRNRYKKMTFMWWLMIHAPIPFIIMARTLFGIPLTIPYLIASVSICVAGQAVGSRVLPKYLAD